MKNNLFKSISWMVVILIGGLQSCTKDLNQAPPNSATNAIAFSTSLGYKEALVKVYGAQSLTGNTDAGGSDLAGIDAGTGDFLRLFYNSEELTTDEAAVTWGDPGLPDFHAIGWTASNVMLNGLYNRDMYVISVANAFIRESSDASIAARGFTGATADSIKHYRAEARYIRAFQYWVMMDLFANPPFVDENSPIGKFYPKQIKRADLFAWLETELKAIDPLMVTAKQNEYGRADQAAVWALLSRMYLNAEVYLGTGKGRYTDAVVYSLKVINAGYSLHPKYSNLFMGDNNKNNPEVILSVNFDGTNGQTWAGTTYLCNAAISGDMGPAKYGVPSGGWGGIRTTQNLPLLFGDYGTTYSTTCPDKRALFLGSKRNMDDIGTYTDGLATIKWNNINSDGTTPSSTNGVWSSIDFPLFRLAEQYLIYAEAVLRGGTGGTTAQAIAYINLLRERAYGHPGVAGTGDITSMSLQDVLDERGRELYWECFRRSDLVRYGLFNSSSYLWPYKKGVLKGQGFDAHYNIFPLPTSDLTANTNLIQNPGY